MGGGSLWWHSAAEIIIGFGDGSAPRGVCERVRMIPFDAQRWAPESLGKIRSTPMCVRCRVSSGACCRKAVGVRVSPSAPPVNRSAQPFSAEGDVRPDARVDDFRSAKSHDVTYWLGRLKTARGSEPALVSEDTMKNSPPRFLVDAGVRWDVSSHQLERDSPESRHLAVGGNGSCHGSVSAAVQILNLCVQHHNAIPRWHNHMYEKDAAHR